MRIEPGCFIVTPELGELIEGVLGVTDDAEVEGIIDAMEGAPYNSALEAASV